MPTVLTESGRRTVIAIEDHFESNMRAGEEYTTTTTSKATCE